MKEKILIIDDKENIREVLATHLSQEGYPVDTAAGGFDGIEQFSKTIHSVVITDVKMPDMDGLQLLQKIKEINPSTIVILITAFADMDDAIRAMRLGAHDYLKKPFKLDEIQNTIEKAIETHKLVQENIALRKEVEKKYHFANIIATSEVMQSIFNKIEKIAPSNSTILISGETGTGKELVAKAVHYNSLRKNQKLVTINCSAIPLHLLESELFGHVKGAFTDAISTKIGKFEEADKGTIFLDEIADMNLSVQAKLLRVLQDGEISRVGELQIRKVDVRVIAATNSNLDAEVENGNFRADLYFRINVIPIYIPPLRERKEDIPLLIKHFLEIYSNTLNKNIANFTPDAMNALVSYNWPGNVRELQNTVERCVLMSNTDVVEFEELPDEIKDFYEKYHGNHIEETKILKSGITNSKEIQVFIPEDEILLPKNLNIADKIIEQELIMRALKKTRGKKEEAAKILGISRRALFYKIRELKLSLSKEEEEDY